MTPYDINSNRQRQASVAPRVDFTKSNGLISNLAGIKNNPVAPSSAAISTSGTNMDTSNIAKMASDTVTKNTAPTIKAPTKLGKAFGKSIGLGNTSGGSIASMALGAFNSIAGVKDIESTGKTADALGAAENLVTNVSSKINPLGSAVASAGKTVGYLIGGKKDRVEGAGSKAVGMVSQGLSYLGPVGMVAGAALNLINGIGGKRVDSFTDLSGQFSSDFSGSAFNVNDTHTKYSNKKAGLFDFGFAKKGNAAVDKAELQQNTILDIQDLNNRLKNNSIASDLNTATLNKYQGNQQIMLSKKGSKFPELDTVRAILESSKVKSFKSGGKIEKENIIPTGALHKNLHNIEDIGIDITKKGIPVVTMDEGGEFKEQIAEVEAAEWTLSLDVTKQIEEYWQNYKESGDDNIAIECGKYLVDQIFNNTRDDDKVIKKTE